MRIMDSSGFTLTAYRAIVMAIRGSRVLNYCLGRRTIRDILGMASWYFLRSRVPNPICVNGHRIYHGGQQYSLTMASELQEPETTRLLGRLLVPGATFVDVGAHIGWYTLLAARAVGDAGHVYAFEPEPSNFSLLRKNVVANGYGSRVTLVQKAVCDVPRRVALFPGRVDSGGSSIYATPGAGRRSVEVEATNLDYFFAKEGWPLVNLMKMDIEGAETLALRGMVELSSRNPGLRLIIEYSPVNLRAAGVAAAQLFDALHNLGFRRKTIISWELIPVETPADILRHAPKTKSYYENLLCEK